MSALSKVLQGPALLPIIQAETPTEAVAIAKAMYAGGISSVEVVLRTAKALDCISAIRAQLPDLLVGAGTILSKADAQAAKDAGSQFLVSPASTPKLLQAMLDTALPLAPGVSTPSEIALAVEMGINEVKFFPANLSGGTPMLKALSGIFQQVRFCPTGGISQQNLAEYLSLSNVFVVGGSWVSPAKAVAEKDWALITELSRQASVLALQLKQVA